MAGSGFVSVVPSPLLTESAARVTVRHSDHNHDHHILDLPTSSFQSQTLVSQQSCGLNSRMSTLSVRHFKQQWGATCLLFLEKRKAEAERIRQKYPDRIPVRVQVFNEERTNSPATVGDL